MNPRLVRKARLRELDWIKKELVYDCRSRTEAEEKGQTHCSDMVGHEQRRQEHTVCEEQPKRRIFSDCARASSTSRPVRS